MLTLGSLFSGIGGFECAALRLGVTPVWASEIEKNCIEITRRHFPDMLHLGDITKLDGGEIPPVDIVSAGSPCQGFSVAGKKEGLEDARSGLFVEAIRIIREMRNASGGKHPTFIIWENVPGVFSQGKGEDFRRILEEFCRLADPEAVVPRPPKGKWLNAGEIVGDGYSLAWLVLDAQHFGVPQRRRRVFAVLDLGGIRAGEILFERQGVFGNSAQGTETQEAPAGNPAPRPVPASATR
jgi:DNA (cytosine-5)-methyltransferase 1